MGKRFHPLEPEPMEVDIRDIAHALARICRFAGHTRDFYSVAQHSVIVSHNVPAEDALWGLLHDAPEAYLSDLSTPVKSALPRYREIEQGVLAAVATRFGLDLPMPRSVKVADSRALLAERRDVLGDLGDTWPMEREGYRPLDEWVGAWPCRLAENLFLTRFWKLTKAVLEGGGG